VPETHPPVPTRYRL